MGCAHQWRRWLTPALGALCVCAAAMDGCADPAPRSMPDSPVPAPKESEFASAMDLLEAIQDGTFAESAGLAEELVAPKLPSRVKIEFVGGAAFPEDQAPELRDLAARLESNERVKLEIIGCSDPSGPAAVNRQISQRRAESVASRLLELGVSEDRFDDVAGRGEACDPPERVVHVIPQEREEDALAASDASGGG